MVKKKSKQNLSIRNKGNERKQAVENPFKGFSLGDWLDSDDVRKNCNNSKSVTKIFGARKNGLRCYSTVYKTVFPRVSFLTSQHFPRFVVEKMTLKRKPVEATMHCYRYSSG